MGTTAAGKKHFCGDNATASAKDPPIGPGVPEREISSYPSSAHHHHLKGVGLEWRFSTHSSNSLDEHLANVANCKQHRNNFWEKACSPALYGRRGLQADERRGSRATDRCTKRDYSFLLKV